VLNYVVCNFNSYVYACESLQIHEFIQTKMTSFSKSFGLTELGLKESRWRSEILSSPKAIHHDIEEGDEENGSRNGSKKEEDLIKEREEELQKEKDELFMKQQAAVNDMKQMLQLNEAGFTPDNDTSCGSSANCSTDASTSSSNQSSCETSMNISHKGALRVPPAPLTISHDNTTSPTVVANKKGFTEDQEVEASPIMHLSKKQSTSSSASNINKRRITKLKGDDDGSHYYLYKNEHIGGECVLEGLPMDSTVMACGDVTCFILTRTDLISLFNETHLNEHVDKTNIVNEMFIRKAVIRSRPPTQTGTPLFAVNPGDRIARSRGSEVINVHGPGLFGIAKPKVCSHV
jgi:hypothetical protein